MIHLMTMTFYAKLFYFISFSSDTVVVSNYGFFSGAAPALLSSLVLLPGGFEPPGRRGAPGEAWSGRGPFPGGGFDTPPFACGCFSIVMYCPHAPH